MWISKSVGPLLVVTSLVQIYIQSWPDVRWTLLIEIIRIHKAIPLRFNSATLYLYTHWLIDWLCGSLRVSGYRLPSATRPMLWPASSSESYGSGWDWIPPLTVRHSEKDTYSLPGQRLCNVKLMMLLCKEICIEYNLLNQVVRWCPWLVFDVESSGKAEPLFICVEGLQTLSTISIFSTIVVITGHSIEVTRP